MPRPSWVMYRRTPQSSPPICRSACSSCSPQSHRSEWNTSPVRHSEWTRTRTSSAPSISPLTSAMCVLPVSFSRNATASKSPYAVGSRTETVRSTSFSVRRRYSIRSATVISLMPWRSQNPIRSGTRAIVPSSFITSQTTPAGISPASRARSTAASVWPVRSSTPPARARSGKMWPGWTRSLAPLLGSIAVWIVRERSAAEIPVVTPSRASIETVKAVWSGASLFSAIGRSASSSTRSPVRQRQISPRACLAMKLIASGVANWAAIVRSPSFSRSAASTTTTNLPARTSSIASSIAESAGSVVAIGAIVSGLACTAGQALDVLGEDVDLEVDRVARPDGAKGGDLQRVLDQRDREGLVVDRRDGERDAVDGDRALLDAVAEDLRRRLDRQPLALQPAHPADPVHVALDIVPTERLACRKRRLEVDRVAETLRPRRGLRHHVEGEVAVLRLDDGQANPVDVDRVSDPRREGRLHDQAAVGERDSPPPLPDDPREHEWRLVPLQVMLPRFWVSVAWRGTIHRGRSPRSSRGRAAGDAAGRRRVARARLAAPRPAPAIRARGRRSARAPLAPGQRRRVPRASARASERDQGSLT